MSQVHTDPRAGDVRECSECGQMSAVYTRVPNSLFVSPAEAAYPGRLPDIYAWTCSRCGHETREAPTAVHSEASTPSLR
jgi:Zn ribbon nucleic-acid-binding protein